MTQKQSQNRCTMHTIWYVSTIQIYWDWDCGGMCVAKLQLSDAQQCICGARGPNVFLNAWDQLRHTRTWSVGRSVARVGAGRLPFCGGISAEPGLTGSGMFGIRPVVLKLASIARCRSLSLTWINSIKTSKDNFPLLSDQLEGDPSHCRSRHEFEWRDSSKQADSICRFCI